MEPKIKICVKCKEHKEENLFAPNGTSKKDGRTLRKNVCKKCKNKERELSRKANVSEARRLANKRR